MSEDSGDAELSDAQLEVTDLQPWEAKLLKAWRGNPKLQEAMKQAALTEHGEHVPETTDKQGNPLPRLNLDDPDPATDDPLLRVGYTLLAQLPEHWESAMLNVTAAADEARTFVVVVRRPAVDSEPPETTFYLPGVAEACSALRRATYEADGRGAWYNAHIRLDPNGTLVPLYDYDTPPFGYWGPNEVDLVRRDHELYPRDPELLPDWHPAR